MQTFDFCDLTKGKVVIVIDVMGTLCIDMSSLGLEGEDRYKLNMNMVDFVKFCNETMGTVVAYVQSSNRDEIHMRLDTILNDAIGMEFEQIITSEYLDITKSLKYISSIMGCELSEILLISDNNSYREIATKELGITSVGPNIITVTEADNLPFK